MYIHVRISIFAKCRAPLREYRAFFRECVALFQKMYGFLDDVGFNCEMTLARMHIHGYTYIWMHIYIYLLIWLFLRECTTLSRECMALSEDVGLFRQCMFSLPHDTRSRVCIYIYIWMQIHIYIYGCFERNGTRSRDYMALFRRSRAL